MVACRLLAIAGLLCVVIGDAVRADNAPLPGVYRELESNRGRCNGGVSAVLRSSDGDLWIGGPFSQCDGAPRQGLARFRGENLMPTTLSAFGGTILALAEFQGDIYIGGSGLRLDSATNLTVLRFRNDTFTSIGIGGDLLAQTRAFAVHDQQLIIGGNNPGGQVQRWDGSALSPLAGLPFANGEAVRTLAVHQGQLFVGGLFPGCLKRLEGNNLVAAADDSLAPCSTGSSNPGNDGVHALSSFGGSLIVGGQFSAAGNLPVQGLVAWQSGQYAALTAAPANGVEQTAVSGAPVVLALASHQGALYVGGRFNRAGGQSAHNLARFDGVAFAATGALGANAAVGVLYSDQTRLLLGSAFTALGSKAMLGFGALGSQGFSSVLTDLHIAEGPNRMPLSLTSSADGLLATGSFSTMAEQRSDGIAVFENGQWTGLIGLRDADTEIRGAARLGGQWIAAGRFAKIDGISVNHMAGFDGSQWFPLGAEPLFGDGEVRSLTLYQNQVYLAGAQFRVNGQTCNRLLRWDGNQLQCMATPDGLGIVLSKLLSAGGYLFAAGVQGIARYDGAAWQMLPGGGGANSLAMHRGQLHANFALGSEYFPVSRWDGAQWNPAGFYAGTPCAGLLFQCNYRLESYGNQLYAINSTLVLHELLAFDGRSWRRQATPALNGPVLAAHADSLFLASRSVDGSNFMAQWQAPADTLFADGVE